MTRVAAWMDDRGQGIELYGLDRIDDPRRRERDDPSVAFLTGRAPPLAFAPARRRSFFDGRASTSPTPAPSPGEEASIMARARRKRSSWLWFRSSASASARVPGDAPAAESAPAKAVAAAVQPQRVLAQIGNRSGNVSYAAFGPAGRAARQRSQPRALPDRPGRGRPGGHRARPAEGDVRRRVDRRRHRARAGAPGVREHRARADRGGLRLPGLDARRGARHAHEDRRSA